MCRVELAAILILLSPGLVFAASPGPQAVLPGPDHPIAIGGFLFRIARVAFDTTAMGFVPEDMGPKDQLMFVEFELLSGNRDDFKGLAITLGSGSGRRSKATALVSGGMMKALSALTVKSVSCRYRPDDTNIAWAFVVQEGDKDFFLTFPTGEVVSLAPLIKENCTEIVQANAQNSSVQPKRDQTIKIGKRKKNRQVAILQRRNRRSRYPRERF